MASIGGTSGVLELEHAGLEVNGGDGPGAVGRPGPAGKVDRLRREGNDGPVEGPPNGSQDSVEISPKANALSEITKSSISELSPEDLLKKIRTIFKDFDLNGDGRISHSEASAFSIGRAGYDRYNRYDRDGVNGVTGRGEFAPGLLRYLRETGVITLGQFDRTLGLLRTEIHAGPGNRHGGETDSAASEG